MKIGELSRRTGLPVVTLRYYQMEGLIESSRTGANYREFSDSALDRVRQIKNFRALNLSIAEMKRLLDWSSTPVERCGEVCHLIEQQLKRVMEQKATLVELEGELRRLLASCSGGGQGGCNILRQLS